jgi:hypothetical protein
MAEMILGSGPIYIAAEPRCPVHGQMRENFETDTWTCAGWDGEGCDHVVRNEDREPVHIGTAGPMRIRVDPRG